MSVKNLKSGVAALAVIALLAPVATALPASAGSHCVTKGAIATAGSEKDAKWYALETMVQAVSWGLWPSFLANGSTPGYKIVDERYKCSPDGSSVTCQGRATFCKVAG